MWVDDPFYGGSKTEQLLQNENASQTHTHTINVRAPAMLMMTIDMTAESDRPGVGPQDVSELT